MNENVAKAASHPLRMQILMILNKQVTSPSELAEELGQPLNHVSYHVKRLVDLKCAELVRTEPRRGAVEHFYRATERPILDEEDFAVLPVAVRRGLADAILGQIAQDLRAAGESGGLERDGVHASNTRLVLDQQGWTELGDTLADALDRFIEIQAETTNRIAAPAAADDPDKSDTFQANVSLMLFENPETSRTPSPQRRG